VEKVQSCELPGLRFLAICDLWVTLNCRDETRSIIVLQPPVDLPGELPLADIKSNFD
jgi:hypothetical protein